MHSAAAQTRGGRPKRSNTAPRVSKAAARLTVRMRSAYLRCLADPAAAADDLPRNEQMRTGQRTAASKRMPDVSHILRVSEDCAILCVNHSWMGRG